MRKLLGKASDGHPEGFELKKADILLEHTRRTFWGWLTRLGTRNYWNHTLMVHDVQDMGQGYLKITVLDPRMNQILIKDVADYFKGLRDYDVGVRRLEQEWFQSDGDAEGRRYLTLVANAALEQTDIKHDSRLVWKMVREAIIVYRFLFQKAVRPKSKKGRKPVRRPLNANAYSCSGFLQWSYYQGTARMVAEGKLAAARLQDVILDPRLGEEASDYDLLSITPAALAKSDKLSWKYLIKDGLVWAVSSEEDVEAVLKAAKSSESPDSRV